MAKEVRFQIAQPITIIGWYVKSSLSRLCAYFGFRYISSFTLIALCATTAGPLESDDPSIQYTLSQAFYYATFSAGLYFIVASLLVVTYYGAYAGHYDMRFDLTTSQRTLMLQTITFLVYLLSGAAVYARVEGWNYADAIYFADYTLLTVGIGNLAPETHLGRSLIFPFAIGGIIILGLVIGSIRSLVLERGKVKMESRLIEKEREHTLKRLDRKGKISILTPVFKDSDGAQDDLQERERRRQEFELMRRVQTKATDRRRWMSLATSASVFFTLWFAGAAIFRAAETGQAWTYFVSLYFSYISLLTIGYGDFYPISNAGRAFFVFWSLLAIPSLTILISDMGDTVIKGIRDLVLWVGSFTVLPSDKGLRASLKQLGHRMTGGKIFKGTSSVTEQPPGFLGETNHDPSRPNGPRRPHHQTAQNDDPESRAFQFHANQKTRDQSHAIRRGVKNDISAKPKSAKHYHVILIREIAKVQTHLNDSPPRKYTFDEWAWYLKLIGEDEDDAAGHRRAPGRKKKDDISNKGDEREDGQREKWSWVGTRSPLMGSMEEAEWVLERLTRKLKQELVGVRNGEVKSMRAAGKSISGSGRRNSNDENENEDEDEDDDKDDDEDDDRRDKISSNRYRLKRKTDNEEDNEHIFLTPT